MTQAKHTPGPWTARANGAQWVVDAGRKQRVASITALMGQEANARLIAAAPDMFSDHMENARILEFLCNELQGRIEGGKLQALFGCLDRSRAVIARATGEAKP